MSDGVCAKGHALPGGGGRCMICRREYHAKWRANLSPEKREARNAAKRKPAVQTWRTDAALARAQTLWEQGLSAAAIVAEIGNGCTVAAIKNHAARRQWKAPRHKKSTWATPENVAKARALYDAGHSDTEIARQVGCSVDAIWGHRRKRKWPPRRHFRNPWRGSDEQEAKIQELWGQHIHIETIRSAVNAIGPKQYNQSQLHTVAARLGLKRPPVLIRNAPVRPVRVAPVRAQPVKPKPKPTGGPIAIPLREVYQRAAQLEIPRSKRGSIEALNRAIKRVKPEHPGFRVADHQPTRLTWTS